MCVSHSPFASHRLQKYYRKNHELLPGKTLWVSQQKDQLHFIPSRVCCLSHLSTTINQPIVRTPPSIRQKEKTGGGAILPLFLMSFCPPPPLTNKGRVFFFFRGLPLPPLPSILSRNSSRAHNAKLFSDSNHKTTPVDQTHVFNSSNSVLSVFSPPPIC